MSTTTVLPGDSAPVILLRADVWRRRVQPRYPTIERQAEAIGVDRSTLFRMLAGTTGPKPSTARRMARLAGTSPATLFELAKS